jgi:hypothetical protein
MHLAQINLGKLAHPLDDPRLADFFAGVEILNRIAARSAGFVWKYATGVGGTVDEPIDGDPSIVVNMTVWRDVESLHAYAFNTLHKKFYRDRARWFAPLGRTSFAMWWIAEDRRPTLSEGLARLADLDAHGPSERAFGWDSRRDARLSRAESVGGCEVGA